MMILTSLYVALVLGLVLGSYFMYKKGTGRSKEIAVGLGLLALGLAVCLPIVVILNVINGGL